MEITIISHLLTNAGVLSTMQKDDPHNTRDNNPSISLFLLSSSLIKSNLSGGQFLSFVS